MQVCIARRHRRAATPLTATHIETRTSFQRTIGSPKVVSDTTVESAEDGTRCTEDLWGKGLISRGEFLTRQLQQISQGNLCRSSCNVGITCTRPLFAGPTACF